MDIAKILQLLVTLAPMLPQLLECFQQLPEDRQRRWNRAAERMLARDPNELPGLLLAAVERAADGPMGGE